MMTRIAGLIVALTFALPAHANIEIEELTSPGGIQAWLVEDHSIPFVAIDIWFRGGSVLEAPEQRGATYMMMGLLEEGAGDMDARRLRRSGGGSGASFGFDSYRDAVTVSARKC
jgi:zinc protease